MENLRTVYDALKEKYGNTLITPADLKAPAAEKSNVESQVESEMESRKLADIDFETFEVGGVNLKSLIIVAINAIVKDNEQELFTGNGTIECTVQDILDYAGLDINDFINEEIDNESEWVDAYFDTVKVKDDHGEESELTFLEALVETAMEEFGKRGWDVTLYDYDRADEGICDAVESIVKIINDLDEEEGAEINQTQTRNLINQILFGSASVDISIEKEGESENEPEEPVDETPANESQEPEEKEDDDELPALLRALEELFIPKTKK